MLALQSLMGVLVLPMLVWLISEDRSALKGRRFAATLAAGVGLQFAIAILLIKMPWTQGLFSGIARGVAGLQSATEDGMRMVFGYLAGAPAPFEAPNPQNGFILAFRALPLILVIAALSRLLYHWGILQRVVHAFAVVLQRTFGISGALGTITAANVFLGPVEAPLLVRPYICGLGRGALFASMVAGMATIAGTVMALYASILEPVMPGAAGHMLAASLMNAPAALMLSLIAVPTGFTSGSGHANISVDDAPSSSIDAIAQGTADGLRMVAVVAAMLVVMVALVSLANSILGLLPPVFGGALTLQRLLGWLCAPLAWLIGIPWSEAATAGSLIGEKVILNEFIAYLDLAQQPAEALSARSRMILAYALCGFANLGSLGIMIGGYIAMAPERRPEIAELAPKAVLVGLMATLLSGAVVGTIVWQ